MPTPATSSGPAGRRPADVSLAIMSRSRGDGKNVCEVEYGIDCARIGVGWHIRTHVSSGTIGGDNVVVVVQAKSLLRRGSGQSGDAKRQCAAGVARHPQPHVVGAVSGCVPTRDHRILQRANGTALWQIACVSRSCTVLRSPLPFLNSASLPAALPTLISRPQSLLVLTYQSSAAPSASSP